MSNNLVDSTHFVTPTWSFLTCLWHEYSQAFEQGNFYLYTRELGHLTKSQYASSKHTGSHWCQLARPLTWNYCILVTLIIVTPVKAFWFACECKWADVFLSLCEAGLCVNIYFFFFFLFFLSPIGPSTHYKIGRLRSGWCKFRFGHTECFKSYQSDHSPVTRMIRAQWSVWLGKTDVTKVVRCVQLFPNISLQTQAWPSVMYCRPESLPHDYVQPKSWLFNITMLKSDVWPASQVMLWLALNNPTVSIWYTDISAT